MAVHDRIPWISDNGFPQDVGQDGAPLVDLIVGDRQGGQQADDRPMCGIDQEPPVHRLGDEVGRFDGQFQADHGAEDANLADQTGEFRVKRLEMAAESLADGSATLEEPLRLDGLDGGKSRATGDGVASEGRGMQSQA